MKKCPLCGAKMPDIARFCGYCGTRLGGEDIFSTALPEVEKKIDLKPPPETPSGEAIVPSTEGLVAGEEGLVESEGLIPEGEGLIPEEEGLVKEQAEQPPVAQPTAQPEPQPAEQPAAQAATVQPEPQPAEQPPATEQPPAAQPAAVQAGEEAQIDQILQPENVSVPENETVKGAMEKLIQFVQQPHTPEEIIEKLRYTRAVIMKLLPYNPLYQELLEWIKAFEAFPPGVPIDENNHKLLVKAVLLWSDRVEDVPGVPKEVQ